MIIGGRGLEERDALLLLISLSAIGRKGIRKLIKTIGSVSGVFDTDPVELFKKGLITDNARKELSAIEPLKALDNIKEQMHGDSIYFVMQYDELFPASLLHIDDPPLGLFIKGRLPSEKELLIAVIGSRKCSGYGRIFAEEIGSDLAGGGASVISGMALGIDAFALKGALDAGGTCYAVLGAGADICYPEENYDLYERIPEKGGIISEYPPKTPPLSWHFPERNRIISGLSRGIAVIEASEKSGSSITVERGLEQGKDIFALPGRADSVNSMGTNKLLQQGAKAVWKASHILEEYGIITEIRNNGPQKCHLDKLEKLVYSSLCCTPMKVDDIADITGLSLKSLYQVLVRLQIKGKAMDVGAQQYIIL